MSISSSRPLREPACLLRSLPTGAGVVYGMDTKTLHLGPQTAEVARIVAGVREEQLTALTPCAGTPVAGLLDHLVGLTLAFRMAAEKQSLGGGPRASADTLVADWRAV